MYCSCTQLNSPNIFSKLLDKVLAYYNIFKVKEIKFSICYDFVYLPFLIFSVQKKVVRVHAKKLLSKQRETEVLISSTPPDILKSE